MAYHKKNGKYFWLLSSVILLLVIFILSIPIRNFFSQNFINNGEKLLDEKKFVSASLEFEKAKILSNKYKPDEKIEKVKKAEQNILILEDDYKKNNDSDELEKIESAKAVPDDEFQGLTKARSMIEAGDYQLALILIKTVIEMDRSYADAWLLFGLANLSGANDEQVSAEGKEVYSTNSNQSFKKVLELDPGNENAKKYLAS